MLPPRHARPATASPHFPQPSHWSVETTDRLVHPGSERDQPVKNRRQKIDTFNAIYAALAKKSDRHRILGGDFNSPEEEYSNGTIKTFDYKNEKCDPIKGRDCERNVICSLADFDLKDTYLQLPKHKTGAGEYSWVNRRQGKETKRRLDHILSSASLHPTDCGYLHDCLKGLSDHAPVFAVYEPEKR